MDAALELKYGPSQRELEAQRRISAQQQTNIGNWYDEYLKHLGTSQQATSQAFQQAQQGVTSQANIAYAQDEADRQRVVPKGGRIHVPAWVR